MRPSADLKGRAAITGAAGPIRLVDRAVVHLNPQLASRRFNDVLCLSLCWRPRCHRVGHCRYRLPLAVREWQPEYQAYFAIMGGKVGYPNVEIDEAKLEALARRIRFPHVPEEEGSSATGAQLRGG